MPRAYDGDPRKALRYWQDADEPPRVCVWEITLKCDLGCKHCGSRAGPSRPSELSTEEALRTVGELAELGVREVILIGGEAYLRDDWTVIAQAVVRAGMACSMVTGAFGFDAFSLEEAKAAGVSLIGVSIDGIAATHDKLRGRVGAFEAAVAAARRIVEDGAIGLSVNSQVNRLSLPELPKLARLVSAIGATGWQLQLTVALGRAADRPDLLLQPFHMSTLMPLLLRIKREILEPAGVQLFLGNNIGYFGPLEDALRYGGERGAMWGGCLAGRAVLGLEADGVLKGCPSLPTASYAAGSVRDAPLGRLWAESDTIKALGRRTQADLWGFCGDCEHGAQCLAGCTWTAHALFGRPGNNPYCHHRAQVLESRNLRERIVLAERAPGLPFDHGRYALVEESCDGPQDEDLALACLMGELLEAETFGAWTEEALAATLAKGRGVPRAPRP